jgi:hypothetical protein
LSFLQRTNILILHQILYFVAVHVLSKFHSALNLHVYDSNLSNLASKISANYNKILFGKNFLRLTAELISLSRPRLNVGTTYS